MIYGYINVRGLILLGNTTYFCIALIYVQIALDIITQVLRLDQFYLKARLGYIYLIYTAIVRYLI